MFGKSIRLYLVDGSPVGLMTAEIMNWTGHVLVAPRSKLAEALHREEADRTGIYFLVGENPANPMQTAVYVGETDVISDRLRNHEKDASKDFWTKACLITSKDTNLTKAHVRYLEARFLELLKQVNKVAVLNDKTPSKKALPESDIADMEFFISQIQLILPVVGFDFLRPTLSTLAGDAPDSQTQESFQTEFILYNAKNGQKARAVEIGNSFVVLKGSLALAKSDYAQNGYALLRESLIADCSLVVSDNPNFLIFAKDVAFSSPSAAAAIINNRSSNGRIEWRLAATGQTLKEWQEVQLLKS